MEQCERCAELLREVERLKKAYQLTDYPSLTDDYFAMRERAEKAEAELEQIRPRLAKALVDNHAVALATERNLRREAEAELSSLRSEADAARPLLEAVKRLEVISEPDGHGWLNTPTLLDLGQAALAYREAVPAGGKEPR